MNSRFLVSSVMVVALFFVLSACKREHVRDIHFEKLHLQKVVPLTHEANSPQCRLSIDMDYCTGSDSKDSYHTDSNNHLVETVNHAIELKLFGKSSKTVQSALHTFAEQYVKDYKQQLTPLYIADKMAADKHDWYEYSYTVATKTRQGWNQIYNYLITITIKEGEGERSETTQKLALNFDGNTGKVINKIADFFVPGFEQKLKDALMQVLLRKTGTRNLDDLRNKGFLYGMDLYPSENFILGDDTITFIYNPSDIASADQGIIELQLDYDDLKDIMYKH